MQISVVALDGSETKREIQTEWSAAQLYEEIASASDAPAGVPLSLWLGNVEVPNDASTLTDVGIVEGSVLTCHMNFEACKGEEKKHFAPCGDFVLTGGLDGYAKLCPTEQATFGGASETRDDQMSFSPDQSVWMVAKDGVAKLWKLDGSLPETLCLSDALSPAHSNNDLPPGLAPPEDSPRLSLSSLLDHSPRYLSSSPTHKNPRTSPSPLASSPSASASASACPSPALSPPTLPLSAMLDVSPMSFGSLSAMLDKSPVTFGSLLDKSPQTFGTLSSMLGAPPDESPSVGSMLHGMGKCRPCAWFWKSGGCQNGTTCEYCHLCPAGEIKARKKAKQTMMQLGLATPYPRTAPDTRVATTSIPGSCYAFGFDAYLATAGCNSTNPAAAATAAAPQTSKGKRTSTASATAAAAAAAANTANSAVAASAAAAAAEAVRKQLDFGGGQVRKTTTDDQESTAGGSTCPETSDQEEAARAATLPNSGSALHGTGNCQPCAWFWKPVGCQKDTKCGFCHLCPEGERKDRKKSKTVMMRLGLSPKVDKVSGSPTRTTLSLAALT